MNRYVVEFIGTFFLVLTIGCVIIGGGDQLNMVAPIAIGGGLMAMIFSCGHISGAHFNPGVTLGMWIRGKCNTADAIPYVAVQLIGAVAAAATVVFLYGSNQGTPLDLSMRIPEALVAEFLFSFALVWVILNVATADGTAGNSFYGLAIGFIIMAGAYSVGDLTGGVFNFAVAIGISIMKLTAWGNIWIYLVANCAGGAAAAFVFKFVNGPDKAE